MPPTTPSPGIDLTEAIKPERVLLRDRRRADSRQERKKTPQNLRSSRTGPRYFKVGYTPRYRGRDLLAYLEARPVRKWPAHAARGGTTRTAVGVKSAVVTVDKEVARDALRAYRQAKAPVTEEDRSIMTAYREIARGRMVVQAIESIRVAGWKPNGTSVLALIRADIRRIRGSFSHSAVSFTAATSRGHWKGHVRVDRMPPRPASALTWNAEATVPLIPLQHRPKASLANYHIL